MNLSFEESMKRLEQIVRIMERGEASLEESLKLFSEGTELIQSCTKTLEEAKMMVQKVSADAEGQPIMEAFENETTV